MSKKIRVAAYCRVSTGSDEQMNSLDNQRTYFNGYIEANEEYEMFRIYSDPGITGTSWRKRQDFIQMLTDAGLDIDLYKDELRVSMSNREPLFNRILVKDITRFARNIDTVDIIRKLRAKGVFVVFTTVGRDTEKESDEFLWIMLLTFAQQDSVDKSAKVIFGNRVSAEKGIVKTNKRIYGYKYIKETNSLEVIPKEATVIKMIFDLYIQGYGIRRILNVLEENGYRTREDKPFVQTTVNRFLSNEKYMGTLVRNKFNSPSLLTKDRTYSIVKPEEEWIVHHNSDKIEPIISKETFDQAQLIRQSKINYQISKGVNKGISEYAGMIVCGKCGEAYTRNMSRKFGTRIYYNCKIKKTKGTGRCNNVNVDLRELEQLMYLLQENGYYQHFVTHKFQATSFLGQLADNLTKRIDSQKDEDANTLKIELKGIIESIDRLGRIFADGKISDEAYGGAYNEYKTKADGLENQIRELTKTNEELLNEISQIEEIITSLHDLHIKQTHSKAEVMEGIKRIIINPTEPKLQVEFKIFDSINTIVQKYGDVKLPNWLQSYT